MKVGKIVFTFLVSILVAEIVGDKLITSYPEARLVRPSAWVNDFNDIVSPWVRWLGSQFAWMSSFIIHLPDILDVVLRFFIDTLWPFIRECTNWLLDPVGDLFVSLFILFVVTPFNFVSGYWDYVTKASINVYQHEWFMWGSAIIILLVASIVLFLARKRIGNLVTSVPVALPSRPSKLEIIRQHQAKVSP
jgi:hypothetical protein